MIEFLFELKIEFFYIWYVNALDWDHKKLSVKIKLILSLPIKASQSPTQLPHNEKNCLLNLHFILLL